MVGTAIRSAFTSLYPREKLEVICVNDGSTDGTAADLRKAWEFWGLRLKVMRFEKNKGKRQAFYEGFRASKKEVVVSLDADSRLYCAALRYIVLPLIRDEKRAALAGWMAGLNENENLLTWISVVRYALAFLFTNAFFPLHLFIAGGIYTFMASPAFIIRPVALLVCASFVL